MSLTFSDGLEPSGSLAFCRTSLQYSSDSSSQVELVISSVRNYCVESLCPALAIEIQ